MTTAADLVFLCGTGSNRHLMTAIDGGEYGQVSLTPNVTFDFTRGGVLEWDVSSLFTSGRDWWDIWILPAGDTRKVICDESYQDTPGFGDCFIPENGIHIRPGFWENQSPNERIGIETWVYRNGVGTKLLIDDYHGIFELFPPDAQRRDTYRVEVTPTSIRTCLPDYGKCYTDNTIAALGWTTGSVHYVHHSYNPTKDDWIPNAAPGTWHWDNLLISPITP